MIFAIAQYTGLSKGQTHWIANLSDDIDFFFKSRTYGSDLSELYIGLITVKPEFDQFFKKRRPRYRLGEKTSIVDGIIIKSNNCAEIDVKIEHAEISKLDKGKLVERVCEAILAECASLTRLYKLKDFDYIAFKAAFENYLIEQSYIKR
ncbi:hypothetical protein [Adhaeribacter radiodurans]|uniref:Uncharacterized protein n=1 Tax=Adhaeribacter radiodurans TaxID=2745197 RepID=A0A7L7L3G3_9BACT|nr:hypothetical protein [Adhaeribacter radiodurans]QMU27115.1 hypothetical protein HUW48_03295 [Adhaeribacter radiodurans]